MMIEFNYDNGRFAYDEETTHLKIMLEIKGMMNYISVPSTNYINVVNFAEMLLIQRKKEIRIAKLERIINKE